MTLLGFVLFLGFLLAADDGVGIDPNGLRASVGSCLDPEGSPRCTQRAFEGGGADPHGRPVGATADEGNGLDPHGKP